MGRSVPAEVAFEHRVTSYLEGFFRELGVPYEKQLVAAQRENIVARLERPGARRTLVLEAHQDTVPTDRMTIPPFAGTIVGNRLQGRGACDIKGGMAAMLACFARLVQEKPAGCGNVIMACSVDEEHTMLGVRELVRRGLRADFAVVAEPTQLNIVHAHKGIVRWTLSTTGRSCHSSTPEQGVNAIYRMGQVLGALERFAAEVRQGKVDPLLGHGTLSVGRIEGGTSVNTVPDYCTVEIDRRLLPGEEPAAERERLLGFVQKAGFDFPVACEPMGIEMPALSPQGSDEICRRLGAAIDAERGSHKVHPVPYGTDAATLAAAGIPSVIFGPGDIARAHTCDEWVPLDEVEQAARILYRLAAALEV
jgi:acetylornithine deacetylase/succinyl-diaminopimelate desuccinylase-like protein